MLLSALNYSVHLAMGLTKPFEKGLDTEVTKSDIQPPNRYRLVATLASRSLSISVPPGTYTPVCCNEDKLYMRYKRFPLNMPRTLSQTSTERAFDMHSPAFSGRELFENGARIRELGRE